ncbi:MFS transporter [Rugamonas rubra]|uniref:Fucose permease n=1 Tax=Rugamonas rubra TaxID=758825 RepID=A0A1I4U5T9_9BURK|nr:MFS transporter [Rugamonas rubra]SFM84171.1 Fucose permease [Rugamonas rubra]
MHTAAVKQARWATLMVFFANGLGIGAWATAIPPLKQALALSDASLSLALLALAAGAVCCMPLSGRLVPRVGGTAAATKLAGLAFAALLPLPLWVDSLPLLMLATLLLGGANGLLDVAMNAHASTVERRWGAAIMSSFHAAFSLGGLAGTGIGAALLYFDTPTAWLLLPTALLALALVLTAAGRLDADAAVAPPSGAGIGAAADSNHAASAAAAATTAHGTPAPSPTAARSARLAVAGLAAIALLCFLVEGAMVDWSGLYLTSTGATAAAAAAGFAAFSCTMVLGRLLGDRVVRHCGSRQVIVGGAALAALGLGLAGALPATGTILAGYAMAGLGLSNVVPAIFSAAGRTGSSAAAGIAMVASIGYAGLLAGPPLIGAVAANWSLRAGVGVMAGAALCAALLTLAVRRRPADTATDTAADTAAPCAAPAAAGKAS